MKIVIGLFLGFLFSPIVMQAAIEHRVSPQSVQKIYGIPYDSHQVLDARDILEGSRKDLEAQLGRKLSLKEKIVFQMAKYQLKRAKRRGQMDQKWKEITSEDGDSSYWIGVVLGLLLGVFGVLIALFMNNSDALRGSLAGLLVWLLIVALVVAKPS